MFVAQLASFRSKDPEKEVGSCIVDKNGKIISMGYNGFPKNHTEVFPWNENVGKKPTIANICMCHVVQRITTTIFLKTLCIHDHYLKLLKPKTLRIIW
jgi:deoxycytidylate deaminase